ncbi:hypothetical protein [Paenibacillus radicis (ex Gao et al. 2016)]|uniref:Uncharacterized protein n=1 Tax=Paenibacillus radicis (ex Gao et al. 2016) TaxID=1737354 RepID=A0A917LYY0_9BACL|nr:hypothetical protein [Paenibacillus radicis (ex Gao et al. 2016)]GGG66293.1 hypothetical protein GCM10010918_20900 [Paenibacillus radicis (ex Gao et al. 2016)]
MTQPVAVMVEADIDYAFRSSKASLEIEGKTLPKGGDDLIVSSLRGEITQEEFLKRALQLARSV